MEALETLVKVKEIFEEAFLAKDTDKIIELIKQHPELPVILYLDGYIYSSEGKEKNSGERLSYAPLQVEVKSDYAWFYFYKWDHWDIDEDIEISSEETYPL